MTDATTDATTDAATGRVTVRLSVPADTSYAVLLRAALAALAARQGFSLDRIEDLRLAGTEAFSLVVMRAAADATVHVSISAGVDDIDVSATAVNRPGASAMGGPGSLGWTLLTSLVDQLTDIDREGELGVWLSVRSDQATPVPPRETPISDPDPMQKPVQSNDAESAN
jgi:anti-sigma regulatory factor (Ser/Thr protein kinase)